MSNGGYYASLDANKDASKVSKAQDIPAKEGSTGSEAALPEALRRKLGALDYPSMETASLNWQEYCKIVLWLEEEKIRLYEQKERRKLRDFGDMSAWYQQAARYAQELGVPSPEGLSDTNAQLKVRVLNALVNCAVHDVYRDKIESTEVHLVAPPKLVAGGMEKQRLRELLPPLNRLLKCWSLPQLTENAIDTDIIAALRCIKTRLCLPTRAGPTINLNLDEIPCGNDEADSAVTQAAGVLRLLHGIELGQLQVNINNVINELQDLVADPKTDARLGRVGS
mmetsp:Transcript_41268/g.81444  ORF Transcript_41268/g.81444 Transcript_41268/m.81444 type:complete len:281 (+) Transcript_41268:72-914(+)